MQKGVVGPGVFLMDPKRMPCHPRDIVIDKISGSLGNKAQEEVAAIVFAFSRVHNGWCQVTRTRLAEKISQYLAVAGKPARFGVLKTTVEEMAEHGLLEFPKHTGALSWLRNILSLQLVRPTPKLIARIMAHQDSLM